MHKNWTLKLCKYHLADLSKFLGIFALATIIAGGLVRLADTWQGDNFAVIFAQGFCRGFLIAMIINLLVNNVIRLFVRFRQNMYGKEAYLTHALPVPTRSNYVAWFITALLTLLFSCAVVAAALAAAYAGPETFTYLGSLINPVAAMLDVSAASLVANTLIVGFLEIFSAVSIGFLAIILGHRMPQRRILFSVIFGAGLYLLTQMIVLGAIYLCALFNDQIMMIFNNAVNPNFNSLATVLEMATGLYLVFIIASGVVSELLLGRGVNVE